MARRGRIIDLKYGKSPFRAGGPSKVVSGTILNLRGGGQMKFITPVKDVNMKKLGLNVQVEFEPVKRTDVKNRERHETWVTITKILG